MVPSGQRPHPAGSPLQAQAPNSHAHMLGLSVHLLLPEPWPAWEVEADDRGGKVAQFSILEYKILKRPLQFKTDNGKSQVCLDLWLKGN